MFPVGRWLLIVKSVGKQARFSTDKPPVAAGGVEEGAKMILDIITVLISVPVATVALMELVEKVSRLISRSQWGQKTRE